MQRFVLRTAVAAVAVLAASALFHPSLRVESVPGAVIFALVLGILNAVVRPVLVILTFPLTLVSLGVFLLVLNALVFWLATRLPGGSAVHVDGFVGAFLGAFAVTVVSAVADRILGTG